MEMTKKQASLIYNEMVQGRAVGTAENDALVVETGGSMAAKLWDAPSGVGTSPSALTAVDPSNYNLALYKRGSAFFRQIADALDVPDAHDTAMAALRIRMNEKTPQSAAENADLRNVIQAACIGGLPALAEAWAKYFPDHLITIAGLDKPTS